MGSGTRYASSKACKPMQGSIRKLTQKLEGLQALSLPFGVEGARRGRNVTIEGAIPEIQPHGDGFEPAGHLDQDIKDVEAHPSCCEESFQDFSYLEGRKDAGLPWAYIILHH